MTRRKRSVCLLLALCLVTVSLFCMEACSYTADPDASAILKPFLKGPGKVSTPGHLLYGDGRILRYDITVPRGTARAYVFPDGSALWCEESDDPFRLTFSGYDDAVVTQLNAADPRSPILIESENGSLLIQPPLARVPGALDGTNYIAEDAYNGRVTYEDGLVTIAFDGEHGDWWVYLSPASPRDENGSIDWLYSCTVEKFGGANRMTRNGYYYTAPSNYIPSGDAYYYCNAAAYIPSKLARQDVPLYGKELAIGMLDIQREQYSDDGFIPTSSKSIWLSDDYGIEAGFYDTRFNTDLAHALLTLGVELQVPAFSDQALDYAAFLVTHANENSYPLPNGGLFADDYSHPDGNEPTHTSLNHQLAEILFLYETGDAAAAETADRLLLAIESTVDGWIRPDGDLYYAHYPDGTYGGSDYPYLTYNDLLALNRHLGGNDALETLMASKKAWMDKNGITAYAK